MVVMWTREVLEEVVRTFHVYMKGYIFKAKPTEFAEVLDLRCETTKGIVTDC